MRRMLCQIAIGSILGWIVAARYFLSDAEFPFREPQFVLSMFLTAFVTTLIHAKTWWSGVATIWVTQSLYATWLNLPHSNLYLSLYIDRSMHWFELAGDKLPGGAMVAAMIAAIVELRKPSVKQG